MFTVRGHKFIQWRLYYINLHNGHSSDRLGVTATGTACAVCEIHGVYSSSTPEMRSPGSGTEIIPGKHSDTRIKPLPLTYTRTDTFFCWGMAVAYNRYKFVTVSLPKRLCNGRFTSETAVRWFQKRNRHLDPEVV
jgi:hypothetical protein